MIAWRKCSLVVGCGPLVVAALAVFASAQDRVPSGLEAAAAIEQAVIEAVAKAEKSVVAIARVRKETGRPASEPPRLDEPPRDLPRLADETDPTDPKFVPSEFGSGVVIDAKGLIVTNYHVLGDTKTADY